MLSTFSKIFEKAFETVNHSLLLEKLDIHGIRGVMLNYA